MFVLVATFWGTSFVSIAEGLHYFPPILFAAIRYDVAGLLVLGYAIIRTDRWRPTDRQDWLAVGIVGAFVIFGHHAFLYLGEQHVPGALAAVIVSLAPVLTAMFASTLFTDQQVTPVGALGFVFGFVGVGVVANPDPANLVSTNGIAMGLVFLSTVSFALGSVLTQPIQSELPAPTLQGWAMVFGAGLLHVVSAMRGESAAAIDWTPTAITSLVYLVVFSGAIAFLLYFQLLDRLGPTELNLVGYLEPVVATLVSWMLLGELVDGTTVAGFAAIFVGFALLKRRALEDVVRSVSGSLTAGSASWRTRGR
ncbi:DMT family transporter [Halomicrococcus gelatinilyticus]|uniref:DMT family transporter n=1 Tax=Halomicrococcus gelatinilyticus TaxID=1702103 RepID=UPI002E11D6CF